MTSKLEFIRNEEQVMGLDLFISTLGNDKWAGRISQPNHEGTDGPLATIQGAALKIRQYKQNGLISGAVHVWIREGEYFFSNPVIFESQDTAPVVYSAFKDEKVVFTGGRKITDWTIKSIDGKVMWVANIPEVSSGKWYFNQLFVNGQRRSRSRLPKQGFYQMDDVPDIDANSSWQQPSNCFKPKEGDINKSWRNLNKIDVIVPHFWIQERMPICKIDDKGLVHTTHHSRFRLTDGWVSTTYAKYYLDNVFEALSEPGEWYLDHTEGNLYYIPLEDEKLEDEKLEEVEVYAPVAKQFIKFMGNPGNNEYVQFITFKNIKFKCADWEMPKIQMAPAGIDYASDMQAAYSVPGVIYMRGAKNIVIENCHIQCIGGYGIELDEGCSNNSIVGNTICDMGAGGIKANGADAEGVQCLRTGNNRITDNHIYNGTHVFFGAIGILTQHSYGNNISHNHIHDLYYSGISVGWVWGYRENISKNNIIEYNHIHHLGKGMLGDMGGIYVLGTQPGTEIRYNLLHDIESTQYGGWGIYLDEGASYVVVEKNLVYNTTSQAFNLHYGKENIIRNNIFALCGEGQVSFGRGESHIGLTLIKNIIITDGQALFRGGYGASFKEKILYSDFNLFWDISKHKLWCDNKKAVNCNYTYEEWKILGHDINSIVDDPGCLNINHHNFLVDHQSPAVGLGFEVFGLDDVGPRQDKDIKE